MDLPELKTTLVVGLGNKARHGKDTAAEILIEQLSSRYRLRVKRYGFADALYAVCRVVHGMRKKDPRLLQDVGLEYRGRDPLVWVNAVFDKIADDAPDVAVIPDTRFHNEAEAIIAVGGVLINVRRLNPDGTIFIADDRPADHPSETENDDVLWDYVVKSASMTELATNIKKLAPDIRQAWGDHIFGKGGQNGTNRIPRSQPHLGQESTPVPPTP